MVLQLLEKPMFALSLFQLCGAGLHLLCSIRCSSGVWFFEVWQRPGARSGPILGPVRRTFTIGAGGGEFSRVWVRSASAFQLKKKKKKKGRNLPLAMSRWAATHLRPPPTPTSSTDADVRRRGRSLEGRRSSLFFSFFLSEAIKSGKREVEPLNFSENVRFTPDILRWAKNHPSFFLS